jgi:hypothetical protein
MSSSWFQVPAAGFAFKAFVIGGDATGRELAEFPARRARGGLLGMALAALIWSGVCIATFTFARDEEPGLPDFSATCSGGLGRVRSRLPAAGPRAGRLQQRKRAIGRVSAGCARRHSARASALRRSSRLATWSSVCSR